MKLVDSEKVRRIGEQYAEDVNETLVAQEAIGKITKDIRKAAESMTVQEARFAVAFYYTIQKFRIENSNRLSAIKREGGDTPHEFLDYMLDQGKVYENQIKSGLTRFARTLPEWPWMDSVLGIGPILAVGLAAHIDITKAPTVGHIWSFAGLDPRRTWEKGQKRPWNADLKTLCWKIGESFVKVSGRDNAYYGQIYKARKAFETERNEQGYNRDVALLKAEKVGKSTEAYGHYSQGKLPPAHIHARAQRYAVKLFLSHYHHVKYQLHYGTPPPKPYAIAYLDHVHYLNPPNLAVVGLPEPDYQTAAS